MFRSKILEEIEKYDYPQFRYLMFMLPIVLKAKTIVETGLGQGHSTVIFLEACRFLGNCKLYTYEIDLNRSDTSVACKRVGELGLSEWWTPIENDSVHGGREWSEGEIDILYLDSDHGLEHVYNELKAWIPHVSKDGVVFSHDTFPGNPDHRPATALQAFTRFANEKGYKLINLEEPEGMCFLIRGGEIR